MKKCAIYSRVSTSMQAEVEYNSCEAQKDRILSYIKSQEGLEPSRRDLILQVLREDCFVISC